MVLLTVTAIEAPQSSITGSLRTAVHHFRTQAGLAFLFRGFSLFIIYAFTHATVLPVLLSAILPNSTDSQWIAHLRSITSVSLLANLKVLWVHAVITKPSSKFSHQQLPGIACWVRTAPVTVLEAAIHEWAGLYSTDLALVISKATVPFLDTNALLDPDATQDLKRGYALHVFGLLPSFAMCMATLPVRTAFIRIAASMLPEGEQPIVPLDPVLKEDPPSGILNAWKNLPSSTWGRVWRVQAKGYIFSAIIFFSGKVVYSDFHRIAHLPMIWFNSS